MPGVPGHIAKICWHLSLKGITQARRSAPSLRLFQANIFEFFSSLILLSW
uniref:Uncharacterized protein n=1 Tax=Utricularia reniformis TaxID=192314 RepID=A0A1Y0B0P1_9LAMI|nr:hypothetical protein AEK19_MT0700 [Utricularia reniformis]ART30947.1 hypothetical protein AEK19_MT0700 [Utricularia reniformis]